MTSALIRLDLEVAVAGVAGVAGVERSEPPVARFRGLTSFDPGHLKNRPPQSTRRLRDDAEKPDRRGVILAVVLVCVILALVIFVSIVRLAAAGRRMADERIWQVQATWLAESGLERAACRLAADDGYTGETWNLATEQFGGSEAAVVRIEVEALPEKPDRRLVRVRADYPDHPLHRARRSKQAEVQVKP